MPNLLATMLPAAMGDILSSQGVAYAGSSAAAFAYAFNALVPKRLKKSADIWVQELGSVLEDISEEEYEDLASIADCFLQIARKGAAEANLHLLARIIAGQKAQGALKADEFLYYADVVSSLRYEEILLLGTLYRSFIKEKQSFEVESYTSKVIDQTRETLVPDVFPSKESFIAALSALTRTGFIVYISGYGGSIYWPTSLLEKMYKLAPLDSALNEEEV